MEVVLNDIINKIKEEGINEAEKKAHDIISKAEKEAALIKAEANKAKEEIIGLAEKEAKRLKGNAEEAIRQTARDTLISLRESLITLFDKVIKLEVKSAFNPEVLRDVIMKLASELGKSEDAKLEILVSEKDKSDLENLLLTQFKNSISKGIVLKVSPKVESGFRIGIAGTNTYTDFTDDAVREAFKAFLNPKIAKILNI